MRLIFTSDTHNNLFGGLAKIKASIKKDDRTIIIDGGDSFSGSPLDYFKKDKNLSYYPQAQLFKAMGLDIAVPGNHDFDDGYDGLKQFIKETGAKLLCANLLDRKNCLEVNRHLIYNFDGLKIGFTGLITDYLENLQKKENLEGLEILPVMEVAREELDFLKKEADVTVLIYHGGYEIDPITEKVLSTTSEHQGYKIITELDYDLVLTAHQHIVIPFTKKGNSYTLQCGFNGSKYAEVEITKDGIKGEVITPVQEADADAELKEEYEKWLDSEIGTLSSSLGPYEPIEVMTKSCGIVDLVNHIQREMTGADISVTSAFNSTVSLDRSITYRELLNCFPFPNHLVLKWVDEKIIRAALEKAASFLLIQNGQVVISKDYTEPLLQLFNYDIYQGIEYAFDLTRPIGKRVIELKLPKEKLLLVLSDYRAGGNGGYPFFKDIEDVSMSEESIQDMLFRYFKENKEPVWPRSGFKGVKII
ncbi:MAG: 5'-nucleotidase C-terminal domain-containing protein [Sphaerochaetaceae bacterium]|nr:5'-nucleotidase C-terminal domain-containing protein [Sphaerochaetaceae bacterium]